MKFKTILEKLKTILEKQDFYEDIEDCIMSWWDSTPKEMQKEINEVYDKHKPHEGVSDVPTRGKR